MNQYQSFIHRSRYARFRDDLGRRETWEETVDRYVSFMADQAAKMGSNLKPGEIREIRAAILGLEVMPSMRALMTAGKALERDHVAGYNCAFLPIDHPKAFDEIMYVLMCGTGVGYSVEQRYVEKLPVVSEEFYPSATTIVVADSKIGWASAYRELVSLLYAGKIPKWDLSKLREAGARLKTFGGRASGPGPLHSLFEFTVSTFTKAQGRRLTSLEVHDLACKIGEVVVVGGVRRCLTGDAKVLTPTGLVEMRELRPGDKIVTGGRESVVSEKVYSGKQETVIVRHKLGQIRLTGNHRVAVFDSEDSYVFKEAAQLEQGDRLVWDMAGCSGEDEIALPATAYDRHFNAKSCEIPPHLTPDLAWLIGLVQGDGYIGPRTIEISSNANEWDTLERANRVMQDHFSLLGVVAADSHEGNGIRLRINSVEAAQWFEDYVKSSNVPLRVPNWIKSSSQSCRAAYLAGLLDSDGRLRGDGGIEVLTSVYPAFIEDVVDVLNTLGIANVVHKVSAEPRRKRGENAQDHSNICIWGNTSRQRYAELVFPWAEKANGVSVVSASSHDFSFPASWGLGWPNRNTLLSSLQKKTGVLTPYAPVPVLAIENGGVADTWDIEVEDIHQFTADNLVTHNSALISLSDFHDDKMRDAKSGAWWEDNPQRALANNSAVYEARPDVGPFMEEWVSLYKSKSGERGIFNREANRRTAERTGRRDTNYEFGTNPCSEIVLRPNQFCNLTEIVVRPSDDLESLLRKVKVATILGTLQSTLTDFRYLRKVWQRNSEEERLLGVSMTGIMDNPITWDPVIQDKLKEEAIEVNAKWAKRLGINQSASITCVKPSGTVSQLVGASSGIHPSYSDYYIRRVRADAKDPLARFLKDQGVPCEPDLDKPDQMMVFSWPQKAPDNAVVRERVRAIEQLQLYKVFQEHWCEHKPSITVYVREDEWLEVGDWVYQNFDILGGVSFLPFSENDHVYKQAPYQPITAEEYETLVAAMPEIDWDQLMLYESTDMTVGSQELACTGGACDITDLIGSTNGHGNGNGRVAVAEDVLTPSAV